MQGLWFHVSVTEHHRKTDILSAELRSPCVKMIDACRCRCMISTVSNDPGGLRNH